MSEFEYVNCDDCDTGLVIAERIVGNALICHCEQCVQQLRAKLEEDRRLIETIMGQPIENAVVRFAAAMQYKLDLNKFKSCDKMNPDGKGRTWISCDLQWLLSRLRKETTELEAALKTGNRDDISKEAADVGNFAMMIHDNVSPRTETGSL